MAKLLAACLLVVLCCCGHAMETSDELGTQSWAQLTAQQRFAVRQQVKQDMMIEHPVRRTRDENRDELRLVAGLEHRVNLLFRSLDVDSDQKLSKQDAILSHHVLQHHLPGVSGLEMASFVQLADTDKDGTLSHEEFRNGMSDALGNVELLETQSKATRSGFIGGIIRGVKSVVGKVGSAIKGFFGGKGKSGSKDEACVYCQYIVERCETNVKQAGVIPALTGATAGPQIFLETESTVLATSQATQNPFDSAASSVIGATRQATRYQRQLERQKYNEIYRVVDITLDDVCEQGMPTSIYPNCKAIYAKQSDVVDGLRYQYRPADICYRIEMCGKGSYITQGVHSRYKKK